MPKSIPLKFGMVFTILEYELIKYTHLIAYLAGYLQQFRSKLGLHLLTVVVVVVVGRQNLLLYYTWS